MPGAGAEYATRPFYFDSGNTTIRIRLFSLAISINMPMLPESSLGLILDMDGVLWRDADPIGDLEAIFQRISARKLRVALATNNSTRTAKQYVERLRGFGVRLDPEQVITSSETLAHAMSLRFPEGTKVYTLGEEGLIKALSEKRFVPVGEGESSEAEAVAMGMDRGITFSKLRVATLLIRAGAPFYATNPDRTFPTPDGLIPGAGALIAALSTATDREPIIVGKPQTTMIELALDRLGTPREYTFVVGDRLETDILAGQMAHCPTALVLSGVSDLAMANAWQPPVTIIAHDLSELIGLA
jgi:4-nitrophenyl phosphatase